MTDQRLGPIAGMLGRRPKRAVGERFAIRWAHEYLSTLPTPVYPIDLRGGAGPGDMWGNDSKGDCGEAGVLFIELYTAWRAVQAGVVMQLPSWTTVGAINEYLAYTGGQDSGVVLADFLLWLYRRGRIKGFAPAPHHDRATCDALMYEFQTPLYTGVNLTVNDQSDFQVRPWGAETPVVPDPSLGHCIDKVFTDGITREDWRTWGAFQLATLGWGDDCVDESWVVITTEEQLAKFDPQLLADLDALPAEQGGVPLPTPVPTPVPGPTPTPVPPVPPLPPPPVPVPPPPPPVPPPHPKPVLPPWWNAFLRWLEEFFAARGMDVPQSVAGQPGDLGPAVMFVFEWLHQLDQRITALELDAGAVTGQTP